MGSAFMGQFCGEYARLDQTCPIYSLRDNQTISGSFAIGMGFGSGNMSSQAEYVYYCKTERGGYERYSTPVQNVVLFMQDGQPMLRWQIVYSRLPKWWSLWSPTFETTTKYDLIVPVGTIIQKFEVR